MKPKLFKQSKDQSLADDSLNYVGTKPKFSIHINKGKIAKKTAVIGITTVAVAGLSIGVLMGLNSFFNDHYFEFRSPVIFQAPILLHDRELLSPIPQELSMQVKAQEPTPTPEPQLVLSAKAKGCVANYPEVAEKLKTAFGDEASTVVELVCRESSLNPQAVNKNSGACGLFQAYPCSKMKCDLADVDCQITWGKDYIKQRYSTAESALLFHDKKGWY